MTTYSIDGFAIYWSNPLDGEIGGDFTDISLDLVIPGSTSSFSYTEVPSPPGAPPEDTYVAIEFGEYTLRLNGETIGNSNQFNAGIFEFNWTDEGGVVRSTVFIVAEYLDVNVPPYGLVDPQYVFPIAGDILPTFSNFADWTYFQENQLFDEGNPTGAFGPDVDIPYSSLFGTVSQDDIITGNGGDNVLFGGRGADDISGKGGRDTLDGGKGADLLKGNGGNDKLLGKGGNDILGGDAGNDRLFGGDGKDKLFGDKGNDILNGGRGNDLLVGGGGADVFVFQDNSGNDRIKGFNTANNKEDINLRAVTNITGFKDLKNTYMSEDGNGNVVIDDGAGTVITILNVALSDLDRGDFIF